MNGRRNIFTHVTSWLTSKNRDQLRKPMIGNRVWVIFSFFTPIFAASLSGNKYDPSQGSHVVSVGVYALRWFRCSREIPARAVRTSSGICDSCGGVALGHSSSYL